LRKNKFEDLLSKTNQIVELIQNVPPGMQNQVFKDLYEAAKDSSEQNMYFDNILKITEDGQTLKDFIAKHKPSSNIERTFLFAYHLSEKGIPVIKAEHIAACYEICNLTEPGNLTQNLRDAASAKYRYLDSVQNGFLPSEKGKQEFGLS